MEIKSIGLIGLGVVGETLRTWILENTKMKMRLYDPRLEYKDDVSDCPIVFISVPVNNKSFKQDLSLIKESIERCGKNALIIIRSSVLPGTCDSLSKEFNRTVCYMPEFLTERRAQHDFNGQDVMAGVPSSFGVAEKIVIIRMLREIFMDYKDITINKNVECEMAKYAHNCFGAMKVTYWNIINNLCEKEGANYEEVLSMAMSTGFINKEHTTIALDGKKGYGGKCFPVNIEAMIGYTKKDTSVAFFKDIYCLNRFFRGDKDLPNA